MKTYIVVLTILNALTFMIQAYEILTEIYPRERKPESLGGAMFVLLFQGILLFWGLYLLINSNSR